MGALIDTSILIDAERGILDLSKHVGDSDDDFFISVITVSELLHGVHRAVEPAVRNRRAALVEGMFERFPVMPIDFSIARAHSRIWADLAALGTLIGAHDLWLAATCIANGFTMITANIREFERVDGLRIDTWG